VDHADRELHVRRQASEDRLQLPGRTNEIDVKRLEAGTQGQVEVLVQRTKIGRQKELRSLGGEGESLKAAPVRLAGMAIEIQHQAGLVDLGPDDVPGGEDRQQLFVDREQTIQRVERAG